MENNTITLERLLMNPAVFDSLDEGLQNDGKLVDDETRLQSFGELLEANRDVLSDFI